MQLIWTQKVLIVIKYVALEGLHSSSISLFYHDAKFVPNIVQIVPNSTKKVYFLHHCTKLQNSPGTGRPFSASSGSESVLPRTKIYMIDHHYYYYVVFY